MDNYAPITTIIGGLMREISIEGLLNYEFMKRLICNKTLGYLLKQPLNILLKCINNFEIISC